MTEQLIAWLLRLSLLAFVVYAMVQWWRGRRELEKEEAFLAPPADDVRRAAEP